MFSVLLLLLLLKLLESIALLLLSLLEVGERDGSSGNLRQPGELLGKLLRLRLLLLLLLGLESLRSHGDGSSCK
jgi:hypothetical protein